MKALKIFLITSFVLLIGATLVVGYVWVKLQAPTSTSTKTPSPAVSTEGIKIDTSKVTEEQKELAKKVGVDLNEVVITEEMISCAQEKLGTERIQEITGGDNPTTLESISLLGCL